MTSNVIGAAVLGSLVFGAAVAPLRAQEPQGQVSITRVASAPTSVAATALGANLIVNGDAEAGTGSADGSTGGTPIPGWTINGLAIADQYGIPGVFIQAGDPGPVSRGKNYFAGGPNNEFSSLSQAIAVKDQAALLDTGRVQYTLSGWLGGVGSQDDNAIVSVYFKDASGVLLSEGIIGNVFAQDRNLATSLLYREQTGYVPKATRTIEIYVNFTRAGGGGGYNDALADNLSLALFDSLPPVTELPSAYYRRALQLLESMRGGPLAPGWDTTVRLGSVARPLFRPDLGDAPAYYEFTVEKPAGVPTAQAAQPAQATQAGFIIVSTGEHDYPIPHWNYEGESPTQELIRKASASDRTVSKFLRMDALYYVGQDSQGNIAAESGTPINRVSGQAKFSTTPSPLTTKEWSAIGGGNDTGGVTANSALRVDDLSAVSDISHSLIVTGPLTGTFVLTGWTSLNELKDNYASSFGTMVDSLKNQASGDWQVEKSVAQYGEALRKGDVYTLPLLLATSTVSLSGIGVNYIQTETLTGGNGLPLLRITVINDERGKELPFTVNVSVPTETVGFVVAPPVSNAYMPLTTRDYKPAEAMRAQGMLLPSLLQAQGPQQTQQAQATEDWGPWNYFWAGNTGDQRIYGQISGGTSPNTSGCASGCGGTAWAMLFGWADHQAALGNSYWSLRRGLYRVNGGYGADADAPATMDAGVRTMTWEIRNRIGTFCAGSSGPTLPWNMDNAQGYLTNRSYAHVSTHYNVLGIHEDRLREYARDSIIYRHTPAVIGTGWLTHYPLAWGYAWRSRVVRHCVGPDLGFNCWNSTEYARFFYVNEGWPGNGSNLGWVSAGTWFAGELYP